ATTEASPRRDSLLQLEFNPTADSQLVAHRVHGTIHQIFAHGLGGERGVSLNGKRDSRPPRRLQTYFVVQRNSLKNCAQFVKSIRALAQDIEAKIDFCECGDTHCR